MSSYPYLGVSPPNNFLVPNENLQCALDFAEKLRVVRRTLSGTENCQRFGSCEVLDLYKNKKRVSNPNQTRNDVWLLNKTRSRVENRIVTSSFFSESWKRVYINGKRQRLHRRQRWRRRSPENWIYWKRIFIFIFLFRAVQRNWL